MDYKSAGVNIQAGNLAVTQIGSLVQKTFSPNVLSKLGHFGGFFELPTGYKEPVLVSCTDGVGTKVKIAIEHNVFNTVGIDLVAMNVNDLICSGAKPLFFLDYYAAHQLVPDQIEQIISGICDGCLQSGCSLIGGEMAEMNDLYRKGDFDLAGFAVGIVEKSKIIDGSAIKPDMNVYGLRSSGFHSNGYSLVRKVMPSNVIKKSNISIQDILSPTVIYVKRILDLLESGMRIAGLAHITGGGLAENINRILPENICIYIPKTRIPIQSIFKTLQSIGQVAEEEMFRVFNMGIGMVVITRELLDENNDFVFLGKTESGIKGVIID